MIPFILRDYFSRGKTQFFYSYLPGKIIDYPGHNLAVKVSWWDSKEARISSKNRLIRRIYEEQFLRFRNRVDKRFPKTPSAEAFYFGMPKKAYCELWPLVFRKKTNNEIFFFKSISAIRANASRMLKENPHEKLLQLDLVFINKLGNIDQLQPVKDPRKVQHKMVLGASQTDYRWVNARTGEIMDRIYGFLDGKRANRAHPIRASEVFMPKFFTVVNQREIEDLTNEFNEGLFYLSAAWALGLHGEIALSIEDKIKELQKVLGSTVSSTDKFKEQLKKLGLDPSKFDEKQIQKVVDDAPTEVLALRDSIQKAKKLLQMPAEQGKFLEGILEYQMTLNSSNAVKISTLENEADETERPKYKSFHKWLNLAGIKDATYLEDVPLMSVAYGFTRGDFEEKECLLKAFPPDEDDTEKKVPIYVNQTKTEAILFELDKTKMLDWLSENNIAKIPEHLTEEKKQAWFFNNIDLDSITRFEGVNKDGVTKHVFSLVHSISHALMKKIPEFCGASQDSLGEIIFPNIPAIMVYSAERTDFKLGFLKEVFESNLHPLIEIIISETRKCVYDPVCIESNEGCCHVCLLTNEISCDYYNKALSRHYLVGDPKGSMVGFWEGII
jgi:hypothetical protein